MRVLKSIIPKSKHCKTKKIKCFIELNQPVLSSLSKGCSGVKVLLSSVFYNCGAVKNSERATNRRAEAASIRLSRDTVPASSIPCRLEKRRSLEYIYNENTDGNIEILYYSYYPSFLIITFVFL